MNRYHLVHITDFHYDAPVSESYNEVRLRPIHDEKQSCLSFRLTTHPNTVAAAYRDSFENWVHEFNVLQEHRTLRVEAESVVLAHETNANGAEAVSLTEFERGKDERAQTFFEYLAPTAYVPHLPQIRDLSEVASITSDGTVQGFAEAASNVIHQRFRYVKGATHVHSSVEHALTIGAGVCQDFAHLLLAVLRARGIPARYVSGYLVPQATAGAAPSVEEVVGGQASHAWVESNLPGTGWTGLDPTLGGPVGLRHVRVAYGRDYGDVAPVRGVYKGHAGQALSVDVRVRPALDGEGHEMLHSTAATPPEEPVEERPQQYQQQQQQQQ